LLDRPQFELVGCYTTSEAKNGRDVGEICGIGPIGVTATTDQEAIVNMPADCVLYMTLEEFGLEKPVSEICRLLRSGKNVVSTATTTLIYPKSAGPDVVRRIEEACREGGTTFHANGIQPGWAGDLMPLMLSGMLNRVDSLLIQEILDYGAYRSKAGMFELMHFGSKMEPVPPTPVSVYELRAFGAQLLMLADALGVTIDEVIYEMQWAYADEAYEIAAGRIEKGTVSGKRYSFTAMIDGQPKIKVEHVTRAGAHVKPEWPQGKGWYVTATGSPSMRLSMEIGTDGGEGPDQACLAAGMHVVHSIPLACAAPPGIQTTLDLPMIIGRGVLA
jgi:hypothetical protein